MDLTATISWPELIWTVACLVGLGVTLGELREVGRDLEALHASGRDGALLIVAESHVRSERARSVVLGLFAAVGVYAMTQLPSPTAPGYGQLLSLAAFVGCAVLMAFGAVMDRRDRRKLLGIKRWDGTTERRREK